jgi:exo-beta-1,3-glucanase (GH17 family)
MKRNQIRPLALLTLAILVAFLPALSGCGEGSSKNGTGSGVSYLFSQTMSGGSLRVAGSQNEYILELRGVSPKTVRFTDRPYRSADAIATREFLKSWPSYFKGGSPNATLVFTDPSHRGEDSAVFVISSPSYGKASNTLTYRLTEMPGDVAVNWKGAPLKSLTGSFQAASLFIDSGEIDADAATGKQFYGLCLGLDPKPAQGYQPIPNSFMDTYLATISPYAGWITDYRVSWKGTEDVATYAVKQAHAHGLKIAACAWLYWDPNNLAQSKSDNDAEVRELISLIGQGYVDAAILGNEPEAQRGGNPGYPITSMAADLVGYINQVRAPGGSKVPVGTRIIGGVGADDWIHTVARSCDFIQVTVHPANWSNKNNTIKSIDGAVAFLDKSYKDSRAQLAAWGLSSTELQIGETGWPTCADSGFNQNLFTVANAAAYAQRVTAWANLNDAKVFWFEAIDEPWKGNFDAKNYDSNWGVWHWSPDNPANPYQGHFTKKY